MNNEELNKLTIDYEKTVKYIFHLSDVRFKLLGILPVVTGIAFSFSDLTSSPINSLVIGLLGLIVTFGILFYDQRNTSIYNGLVSRAKALEKKMQLPKMEKDKISGGTFQNRKGRERKLFDIIPMWHDKALALIYSVVIWVWLFIVCASSIKILGIETIIAISVSIAMTVVIAIIMYRELIRLDKKF